MKTKARYYCGEMTVKDMEKFLGDLRESIEKDNIQEFRRFANSVYYYEYQYTSYPFKWGATWNDREGYYEGAVDDHEVWSYRPALEALFVENPEGFKEILNQLIDKNNSELFDCFYRSLQNTILERRFVVEWKTDQHGEQLKEKIKDMREVNDQDSKANAEKKQKISALLDKLEEKINSFETVALDNPIQAELRCLLFRNELLTIARSEEAFLKEDEPYFAFMQSVYELLYKAIQFISCGRYSFFAEAYVDSRIKSIQNDLLPK